MTFCEFAMVIPDWVDKAIVRPNAKKNEEVKAAADASTTKGLKRILQQPVEEEQAVKAKRRRFLETDLDLDRLKPNRVLLELLDGQMHQFLLKASDFLPIHRLLPLGAFEERKFTEQTCIDIQQ